MTTDASNLVASMHLRRGELTVDVELTCKPGITCIMGPSGAGKSTVLGVLAGLVTPEQGTVTLGDTTWLDRGPGREKSIDVPVHHRRLSYMFQNLALFPHMTARQNVEYGMHDIPREERTPKALDLLAHVGVKHLAHRRPRTFSGGEAQRVALARAIARRPKLLLLDEPFSALDRELRAQLVKLVREFVADLRVPLVHVTHSHAEARALADHVVVIDKGRLVRQGSPSEILAGDVD
ncbi:MAG: ATP-binding cassette domain-containing protein [Kofleriaceae bacterium]